MGKKFYRGEGCDKCNGTGYKGRVGLFEFMIFNDEIRDMIMRNASTDELLFDQTPPSEHAASPPGADSPTSVAEPGLTVQRADERAAITLNSGVTWERLTFWADEDVEFIEATYEPGGASSPDDALVRHSGHEFGHVLSGTLRVVVGFDEFVLEPGDSITFPSSTPHRLSNEGDEAVRAIWVVRGRRGENPGDRTAR